MSEKLTLAAFHEQITPRLTAELTKQLGGANNTLTAAMNYSVMSGGKRMRPLLVLLVTYGLRKMVSDAAVTVAASVELLHTYSLIHDDLPAMDNDKWRRGKLTNHEVFGAGMATLAGDALLTQAFNTLATAPLPAAKTVALVQALSAAAGPAGMCAGQASDLLNEGRKLTLAELTQLHRKKTGALLEYCCVAGGILGGASQLQLEALHHFGAAFGLAFQIKDDLSDVAQDQSEHKNSYVGLLGTAGAKAKLEQQVTAMQEALAELAASGMETPMLTELLNYFTEDEA